MSKNFENEYKAFTETEVPDLWDRIEAGLTPKSAQNPEKNEASMIDFKKETAPLKEAGDMSGKSNQRKTPVYFMKKYKTVLAAAVCVIVILPAAVVIGKMGIGTGGAKESIAEDTAAAETMEYAVTTEAASEETEMLVEEAAAKEAAPAEIAMAEETIEAEAKMEETEECAAKEGEAGMPAEMAADTDGNLGNAGAGIQEESMAKERSDCATAENEAVKNDAVVKSEAGEVQKTQSVTESVTAESAEEEMAATVSRLDVEDGTVLKLVEVRIYGQEEVLAEGETKGLGNLYRAEVLEDADGLLMPGEEILIYISPLSSTYLPDEEATYKMMLEYDSTREYPFYLKSCY